MVIPAVLTLFEHARTHRVRRSADGNLAALGVDDLQFVFVRHPDVGHGERLVNLDARRLDFVGRQVVIADEHDQRREPRQVADAVGELALIGGVGAARLEGVAREDRQVNVVLAGEVDHLVHAAQKVADAAAQAGFGVGLAVVFHADVNVGEVQHADRFGHVRSSA